MKNSMLPRVLLSETADSKRRRGRHHRKVGDSVVESINLMTPSVGKDGPINNWSKLSKDVVSWEHMVKSLVFRD